MYKVGIFGATGRVGRLIIGILKKEVNLELSTVFARKELDFSLPSGTLVTNDYKSFLEASDIIIDFSLPEAMESLLETAISNHAKPIVIGTTGLNEHQQNLINEASKNMPILYASNMSLGIALLNKLAYLASNRLSDFDIEITEMHHRYKKDSPSGTALTLGETVAKARDLELDNVRISGRDGNIGERNEKSISVMSLRGGDIVGKHTVGFYNDGEFIELTHVATSRETFAKGAVKAAKWLISQPIGLYSINDCLEL